MLSSLAEMETRQTTLQMQTRIHSSSGMRSALQTPVLALQLCVVSLHLWFTVHLLLTLTFYLS